MKKQLRELKRNSWDHNVSQTEYESICAVFQNEENNKKKRPEDLRCERAIYDRR